LNESKRYDESEHLEEEDSMLDKKSNLEDDEGFLFQQIHQEKNYNTNPNIKIENGGAHTFDLQSLIHE
jgi:hypothetical protein